MISDWGKKLGSTSNHLEILELQHFRPFSKLKDGQVERQPSPIASKELMNIDLHLQHDTLASSPIIVAEVLKDMVQSCSTSNFCERRFFEAMFILEFLINHIMSLFAFEFCNSFELHISSSMYKAFYWCEGG